MKFSKLAKYLQKLEDTTKRLEITSILADLISELDYKEIDLALYLSLGYLKAEFESEKFNIAEKMMIRILSAAYNKTEEKIEKTYKEIGDLGSVAYKINTKKTANGLSVEETHEKLLKIAKDEGSGSQDRKVQTSADLLKNVDRLSAKYLVRIILGTTRLGFTELTVIDALTIDITNANGDKQKDGMPRADKEIKSQIEQKYRIHPDIGLVAKKLKQKGLKGLNDIDMEVGVPVHAMLAQRMSGPGEIIERMQQAWVEYKFDGTRVQLHMDRDKKMEMEEFEQQSLFDVEKEMTFIKTYTRNLEETTHQYPDIIEAAEKQIDAKSIILDGEAIGIDKETGEFLPFQETIQRKRKHGVGEYAKEIPLKYLVFDLLYLNGKSLIEKTLKERREILKNIVKPGDVIEVDEYVLTDDAKKLEEYLKEALEKGLEGIMVKRPDTGYEAGARNFNWVKLKKTDEQILADSVDCVVLGYYAGRGARAQFGIGGFLAAVWDEKDGEYKTLTKVGTGLTDDQWKQLKTMCDKVSIPQKPENTDIDKKYDCDVWVKPNIVVELGADELSKSSDHSLGYALRFPRLIKFRNDKKPKETTTPKEIKKLYDIQKEKSSK